MQLKDTEFSKMHSEMYFLFRYKWQIKAHITASKVVLGYTIVVSLLPLISNQQIPLANQSKIHLPFCFCF